MLRILAAVGLALIVVGGVVACGSEATETPMPTDVRVAESLPTVAPMPTNEPTVAVDSTAGITMPTTLEGPMWSLVGFGDAAAPARLITDTMITAQFVNGNISGHASCNGYFAEYTVDGSALTIGMPGMTMVACSEDIMAQEQAYLAVFQQAATFTVDPGRLLIHTADGQFLLYEAETPFVLAGSKWVVTSFNNGNEAMAGVIAGTEITAEFSEDEISGSAGCNDYSATYDAGDGTIEFGPATNTEKACPEPEGIMEQEQQFLAALATGAVWRVEADVLEMRTADGSGAVSFRAAEQ